MNFLKKLLNFVFSFLYTKGIPMTHLMFYSGLLSQVQIVDATRQSPARNMWPKIGRWVKNGGPVYVIMVLSLVYLLYVYLNSYRSQVDNHRPTNRGDYSWINDIADFLLIFEGFTYQTPPLKSCIFFSRLRTLFYDRIHVFD